MSIIGKILRVSTFGQSHSPAVGCTIQGFPSNFLIDFAKVQQQLDRRKPGQSSITTSRKENDTLKILSGIQNNLTLGSPITMMVENQDFKIGDYKRFANVPRPGHADFTYKMKYGILAESGGGRSSARQTLGRVLAGSICKQYLISIGVSCSSWVYSVGNIHIDERYIKNKKVENKISSEDIDSLGTLRQYENGYEINGKRYDVQSNGNDKFQINTLIQTHITRCPSQETALKIVKAIKSAKQKHDSIGGVVQGCIYNLPIGLGRPVFDKFPAVMAHAMLSIPATKGFQYGSGFSSSLYSGSQHNDQFIAKGGLLKLKSNNSGGTLGGITTGETFHFKVAFKPPSTIGKKQTTANYEGEEVDLQGHGRHDPCVLPRAPPIVDAMSAIAAMDEILHFNSIK